MERRVSNNIDQINKTHSNSFISSLLFRTSFGLLLYLWAMLLLDAATNKQTKED